VPDFIVKVSDNQVVIVETKGREEIDVPQKMAHLKQWCVDVNAAQGEDSRRTSLPPSPTSAAAQVTSPVDASYLKSA
jgi:hypothetical protein